MFYTKNRLENKFKYLIHFGVAQALCCIFPVAIFLSMAFSKVINIPHIPRYDFIFIVALLVQIAMVYFKLETIDEVKVISLFHVIGLLLEIYKIHIGSWSYPEEAYLKIAGVPLYSGFMYSSIASYICQSWKRMNLRFLNWPSKWLMFLLSAVIYINFFTNHYIKDIRWFIIISLFFIFNKSYVAFKVKGEKMRIHLILSFFLIGFFIWIAENISTFLGAWQYPHQSSGWNMVHTGKITSWFLLVIISIMIVVNLKQIKYKSVEE